MSEVADRIAWIGQFLLEFRILGEVKLLSQDINSRQNLTTPLDFNLNMIIRRLAHNPRSFFNLNHLTISQLIIKLKHFIIAINPQLTANKVIWNVKFYLKLGQ
jgi:hypothetical protein